MKKQRDRINRDFDSVCDMTTLRDKFFAHNQQWASAELAADRNYFATLSAGQTPCALWLGCCDARLMPAAIVGAALGELFVQTTIANQVHPDNSAVMSAIEYALTALKVEHIIVCGHTCCGGIAAAIDDTATANLKQWLAPLRQLYLTHRQRFGNNDHKLALSELNLKQQVTTIANLACVRHASQTVHIHAWLFKVETGLMTEICCTTVA